MQVYEDTIGLTVGEPILFTGNSLSVELGPGMLGNIFDGIQRPLKDIAEYTRSIYIPKGLHLSALSRSTSWEFEPARKLSKGNNYVRSGDVIGFVEENSLLRHVITVPPDSFDRGDGGLEAIGKVTYVAPAGRYKVDDVVLEAEFENGVRVWLATFRIKLVD